MTAGTVASAHGRRAPARRPRRGLIAGAARSRGARGATWGTWGDLDSDTGYDVVAGTRGSRRRAALRRLRLLLRAARALPRGARDLLAGRRHVRRPLGLLLTGGSSRHLRRRAHVVGPVGATSRRAHHGGRVHPDQLQVRPPAHDRRDARHAPLACCSAATLLPQETPASSASVAASASCPSTKPEPALAGIAAVTAGPPRAARADGQAQRSHRRRRRRGPAAVYGAFLSRSPDTLVSRTSTPRHDSGGGDASSARMPLTPASFVELGGRRGHLRRRRGAMLALAARPAPDASRSGSC